jgi:hypothetical protein
LIVSIGEKESVLPDFFIVGAAKSGTTALVNYLEQHPQIVIPFKDTGYFCSSKEDQSEINIDHDRKVFTLDDYITLYKDSTVDKTIGDATTRYLYLYNRTIANIEKTYQSQATSLKIIIILRNPVERAFSHYVFNVLRGLENLTFEESLKPETIISRELIHRSFNYINFGKYYEQVRAYLQFFTHTRVFLFEDLKDPDHLVQECFKFLQVSEDFHINPNIFTNPSGIPRNRTLVKILRSSTFTSRIIKKLTPQKFRPNLIRFRYRLLNKFLDKPRINIETAQYLKQIYQEDIIKLQGLINKDLKDWLH